MELFFRQLHHIDKDVTLAINSLNCPASDFVWTVFSNRFIWAILYVAVLFFLFRNLGWKKALIVTASVILTITCCDQLANFTKEFFARLRPCWDGDMIAGSLHLLEDKGNLYGFYSAHAANAMGFAASTFWGFRWNDNVKRKYRVYGWCIFIWAALVGISRIFVGKHFTGDVLVGFAVGLAFGLFWAWVAKKGCERVR
ncbi:MAG: phosphatase PAP2 family protein [Bacteroidales bacterium]|nr:phosphatase PAP2 family protein [Bacteroidales bacterium]